MAIRPSDQYPGQIDTSDPINYPNGKARNITASGDNTGTPWDAPNLNEWYGATQALLTAANITANGNPETVASSQYLESLQKASGIHVDTTPGAVTFNIDPWIKRIKITVVGGGGGGARGPGDGVLLPGGGGSGGIAVAVIDNPPTTFDYFIGSGGDGATSVSTDGDSGTSSWAIDPATLNAPGGQGGGRPVGGTPGFGSGTALTYRLMGQFGGPGIGTGSITPRYGGAGGGNPFGAGGRGSTSNNGGGTPIGAGAGGGGDDTAAGGGNGSDGMVIIEWGIGV